MARRLEAWAMVAALGAAGHGARAADAPATAETARLTITAGESRDVAFPPGSEVSVSRRGVLDVFPGPGGWKLTGLQRGFVVVEARDPASGRPSPPRLLVEVESAPDGRSGGRDDEWVEGGAAGDEPPGIPGWICRVPGLECDAAAGVVTGVVASPSSLARLRRACSRARCLADVRLSGTARTTWTEALRAELGDQLAATVEVTVTPSGRVVLTTPCSSDGVSDEGPAAEAARRLGLATEDGAGDGGPVVVACRGRRERYRLSVRIQAVSESTAKTLGFDGGAALSGAWARSRSFAVGARGEGAASSLDARLWTELQNLSQSHDADILGTPVLRLTAGAPGELSTGGEFPVAVLAGGASGSSASADVYQREWKSYGLTLKATAGPGAVTAHAGPLVRLALDVTLKTRAGARSGTLSVTTLKSTVEAAPSAPTMIGIVELASDEREETERQGLASVPIIGPLFRRAASGHAKEHAVVWATVEVDREDEAQGDLFVPPKPSRDAPEASKSGAEPSSMETAPKTGYPDGTTPQGSPR